MNGLFDEIKSAFNRQDNALIQLILINIIVFLGTAIIATTLHLLGFRSFYESYIAIQFELPSVLGSLIWRPHTLLTYAFQHAGLLHILFNMLFLYWFGAVIVDYLGSKRIVSIYILGALAGALGFLILSNTLLPHGTHLVGASGAVFAVMVAAATLAPDHTFYLLLFGPVRIKYIVPVLVILAYVGLGGSNAGGEAAHLGGALMGYIYIVQLKKGNDLGAWIFGLRDSITGLFKKKSKVNVSYSSQKKSKVYSSNASNNYNKASSPEDVPNQEEVDAILDKISETGYSSLSKEEKQKLFNASKEN
jgi:membrane associated rhomboid family serine protease